MNKPYFGQISSCILNFGLILKKKRKADRDVLQELSQWPLANFCLPSPPWSTQLLGSLVITFFSLTIVIHEHNAAVTRFLSLSSPPILLSSATSLCSYGHIANIAMFLRTSSTRSRASVHSLAPAPLSSSTLAGFRHTLFCGQAISGGLSPYHHVF